MWQHEHLTSTQRSPAQMEAFRDCLEVCELMDMGFVGVPFTYNNNQFGNRNVQVRLDRGCSDEAWRDLFPAARVRHLVSPVSHHAPLLIQMESQEPYSRWRSGARYEIMWERHSALPDVIANAWSKKKASNLGEVAANLKTVMTELKEWSREHFGHVSKQIERLRQN